MPSSFRGIPWDTDGINGQPSSITILLDWLTANNNYARWCTTPVRDHLCAEILAVMSHHDITHRTARGISMKIDQLKHGYQHVADLLEHSGLANDPNTAIGTVQSEAP
ncbi:hypothetical protein PTTG_30673 [Puccinia triticina 1-1 BBBD Race 1]|uniref:Uncharacterized protein n=1 Tax=Puccinia triticina (isolate 1-1 / race 1 (BBBD)) TaxID=630390 RepID=A0A180FYI9_PUCT1|nr:hypothetical protein PTTG_30673 [Puccinia triticina 1-1 BBBD Race 1]